VLRRQRGAAALVLLGASGALFTGALGVVDVAAAVSAQARAQSAADALAHGTAAFLLGASGRDELSIAVQAGTPCDTDAGGADSAGPACVRAVVAARELAGANSAVLRRLIVGPDPRDMRDGRAAGRFLVEAHVFVARGLPIRPGTCPNQPGSGADLCWADAWAAAQGAG
jgi:hypothetical protein